MNNLLLTGAPGAGKTTIIRRVADGLDDLVLDGMITEEIRRGGQRVGFRIEDLDGEGETMAHVDIRSSARVGRYGVDVGVIDRMVDRTLVDPTAQLLVIDEIGKMECFSRRFVEVVAGLLDGPTPVVATIGLRAGGFIARVRARHDVELWEATAESREAMPRRIVEWVRRAAW